MGQRGTKQSKKSGDWRVVGVVFDGQDYVTINKEDGLFFYDRKNDKYYDVRQLLLATPFENAPKEISINVILNLASEKYVRDAE